MPAFCEDGGRSTSIHSIRSHAFLVFKVFEVFEFCRRTRFFALAGCALQFLHVFLNGAETLAAVLGEVAAISRDRIEDASALADELRRNPIILSNAKAMAGA